MMSCSVIFTEGLRKAMENLSLVFKPWCLIYGRGMLTILLQVWEKMWNVHC